MRSIKSCSVFGALVCSGAIAQAAGVTNGGFETGTLAGWYSSGTTAMASGAAGYFPMSGNHSALVVAMSAAPVPPYNCIDDRWNINCPQPLPFAASGAALPTHQSAFGSPGGAFMLFNRGGFIAQDLSVAAGDVLRWNWIPGGEAGPGVLGTRDGGRFYATNGSFGQVIDLSTNQRSFTFPQAGLWSVYFGLFQGEDPLFFSTLQLDNIAITPVPEPATWLLALGGLSAVLMRRRQPAAA